MSSEWTHTWNWDFPGIGKVSIQELFEFRRCNVFHVRCAWMLLSFKSWQILVVTTLSHAQAVAVVPCARICAKRQPTTLKLRSPGSALDLMVACRHIVHSWPTWW